MGHETNIGRCRETPWMCRIVLVLELMIPTTPPDNRQPSTDNSIQEALRICTGRSTCTSAVGSMK